MEKLQFFYVKVDTGSCSPRAVLGVRHRSTKNWIRFRICFMRGSTVDKCGLYWEMTSGNCLRIPVSLRSLFERGSHISHVKVDSDPSRSVHTWKSVDGTSLLHLVALARCLRCLRCTLLCSTSGYCSCVSRSDCVLSGVCGA